MAKTQDRLASTREKLESVLEEFAIIVKENRNLRTGESITRIDRMICLGSGAWSQAQVGYLYQLLGDAIGFLGGLQQ